MLNGTVYVAVDPMVSPRSISTQRVSRRSAVGPEPLGGETHFRVWAPESETVSVVFHDGQQAVALQAEGSGYFSGTAPVVPGARYKYQLDGGEPYPDPASRYQPDGPHGFSQVIDPDAFPWSDKNWRGAKLNGQVVYEMHIGTFTTQGTWRAATEKLSYLRDTGITMLEVMPVAEFPGRFGWGYDGVQPYAPVCIYGTPDDMRDFINRAHSLGIAVVLDVVYNHLGPDGNYLPKFSSSYFSKKHKTDWGVGLNFDGPDCEPVREFFAENAAYWIRDFHLDGLRIDATQDIHDNSPFHILAQISQASRRAAGERSVVLIGENEPQNNNLLRPVDAGGCGLDALWNDDYHHTAIVALTGKADAYYTDYRGTPQEFVSAMKYGYLFQGQWYAWQKKRRGTSLLGFSKPTMVTFIQNHDQIANSTRGERVRQLSAPGVYKAITALTLLGPGTPMLFQGQEFGSSSPFLFFADQKPELGKRIKEGRIEFLAQWRSHRAPDIQACFPDPTSLRSFEASKLDFSEVEKNGPVYRLHCDLLKLRREDPVFCLQGEFGIDGAVLSPSAFVIRYFSPDYLNDRLLVVNLGAELHLESAPEPLLGPPAGKQWDVLWSSDAPGYGGCGTAPLDTHENWRLPGQSAVVLYPVPVRKED
jgi:maltooligosyltrehalose trehalohydrolase